MKTDLKKTVNDIVSFIQAAFRQEGFTNAIIGLSGGIDSATSCALSVHALGVTHVYPVLLPYGSLNNQDTKDAKKVILRLKIPEGNVRVIDIQPVVDVVVKILDPSMDDPRRGNVMARIRMIVLYDFMKALPGLVVGTENKTEHLLGYYTKFGDEASDIEPLRNLYKTDVYELARYLGIPGQILSKAPSAGLWDGQTDEGEFGFTYKMADEVLMLHHDQHIPRETFEKRGFDKKLLDRMWFWLSKGEFKQRVPHMYH